MPTDKQEKVIKLQRGTLQHSVDTENAKVKVAQRISEKKMANHGDSVSLFNVPVYDNTVRGIEWVQHRPVGQLNSDGALEFNVSGNSTKYIDLKNTRLKIKFRIVLANGKTVPSMRPDGNKPVPDIAKVGPVNLFLQSMWRQVDVSVQQQLISPNISTNYPYKAYLETVLESVLGNCTGLRVGSKGQSAPVAVILQRHGQGRQCRPDGWI